MLHVTMLAHGPCDMAPAMAECVPGATPLIDMDLNGIIMLLSTCASVPQGCAVERASAEWPAALFGCFWTEAEKDSRDSRHASYRAKAVACSAVITVKQTAWLPNTLAHDS
jgi:hypothetical protein